MSINFVGRAVARKSVNNSERGCYNVILLSQDNQCFGRESKRVPIEYKSRALPLHHPVLFDSKPDNIGPVCVDISSRPRTSERLPLTNSLRATDVYTTEQVANNIACTHLSALLEWRRNVPVNTTSTSVDEGRASLTKHLILPPPPPSCSNFTDTHITANIYILLHVDPLLGDDRETNS
jgi:hypothetical protein